MGAVHVDSILPRRAPVVPRGTPLAGGERLPLEAHVRALLQDRGVTRIAIVGPPGSGRTTALAHLAATLSDLDLDFADEPADPLAVILTGRRTLLTLAEPRDLADVSLTPAG